MADGKPGVILDVRPARHPLAHGHIDVLATMQTCPDHRTIEALYDPLGEDLLFGGVRVIEAGPTPAAVAFHMPITLIRLIELG